MIHATMITSIAVIMIFAILAINHSVILITRLSAKDTNAVMKPVASANLLS